MDLFLILGLEHGATESDIKRAYRRLARRYHPDINPGDRAAEVRFQQILEAYETLIDPARRSRYEAGHSEVPPERPGGSGFEGFDFSARAADQATTFGDLFADVLAGREGRPKVRERGADIHLDVTISFEQSFSGTSRTIALTRQVVCQSCAGSGAAHAGGTACLVCQGSGSVRSARGHMVFTRRCGSCGGSGRVRPRNCATCGGSGRDVRADTVTVGIPPGVDEGTRLRVEGMGHAGLHGGPAGDVSLVIRVAPHDVFRREGRDVHVVAGVPVHEAALGGRIDVPSPDGGARLRVPPGTQSGQRFRLRERGMPSLRDGRRGDLIVEVQLKLPAVLDERSKELLREFGRINGAASAGAPRREGAPILAGSGDAVTGDLVTGETPPA
jgi:molecular chaperone DnaJ